MRKMTQKQILKTISEILHRHQPGDFLTSEESQWVIENRLKFHHEWALKNSLGKLIGIRVAETCYKTVGMLLEFDNGKNVDISYWKGYAGKDKEMTRDVIMSIREADKERVDAMKEDYIKNTKFPYEYELDGHMTIIEDISVQMHVDHYDKDFIEAASEWINMNGGVEALHKYVFDGALINSNDCYFTDENIRSSAKRYMAENTKLRVISKEDNLNRRKQKNTINKQ